MNKTIIHNITTQEEYKQLVDKIGWDDGKKYYNYWKEYQEETAIVIEDGEIYTYSDLGSLKNDPDYKDYTYITAQEVLGEYKVGDVFEDKDGKRELLAILPDRFRKKYLLSWSDDFDTISGGYTKEELDEMTLVKDDDVVITEDMVGKRIKDLGFKIQ